MIADLCLVTYQRDYKWLDFLFRSIVRHVRGFRQMHVIIPVCGDLPASCDILRKAGIPVVGGVVQPWLNSYKGMPAVKMMAWQQCDADAICFVDSDLLFVREFTPESMMTNGKIRIEGLPWEQAGAAQCWRAGTEKLLGFPPPYETMQRHPFMYLTQTIRRVYNHIGGESGYMAVHNASEYDILGNYAITKEPDAYQFVPFDPKNMQYDFLRKFRTHGGITPHVEAELKAHGFWEG